MLTTRMFAAASGGSDGGFRAQMPRNLSRRVEILVPVESRELRDELDVILHTMLHDRRKGRRLLGDNHYSHTAGTLAYESERAQVSLHRHYQQRLERAQAADAPATEF